MTPELFPIQLAKKSGKAAFPLSAQQKSALERFKIKIQHGEYSFEDQPCLCHTTTGKLIARQDRYGLSVHTYLCRFCGMMWTNPQLTEQSLNKFYEEDYRQIYVGEEKASDAFFYEQVERGKSIYKFIDDRLHISLKTKLPLKVYEVGCGAGGILIPFKDAGCQVYGCDIGRQYLEYGRYRGLVLEHGDALSLQKHGRAQLVMLNHVLEHLKSPVQALAKIASLVDKSGYIYIEVPGILNVHNVYGDIHSFLQNAHIYHFTLETLSALMAKAGFQLVAGNQHIHALFKQSDKIQYVASKDCYMPIYIYLYLLKYVHNKNMMKISSLIPRLLSQYVLFKNTLLKDRSI